MYLTVGIAIALYHRQVTENVPNAAGIYVTNVASVAADTSVLKRLVNGEYRPERNVTMCNDIYGHTSENARVRLPLSSRATSQSVIRVSDAPRGVTG